MTQHLHRVYKLKGMKIKIAAMSLRITMISILRLAVITLRAKTVHQKTISTINSHLDQTQHSSIIQNSKKRTPSVQATTNPLLIFPRLSCRVSSHLSNHSAACNSSNSYLSNSEVCSCQTGINNSISSRTCTRRRIRNTHRIRINLQQTQLAYS